MLTQLGLLLEAAGETLALTLAACRALLRSTAPWREAVDQSVFVLRRCLLPLAISATALGSSGVVVCRPRKLPTCGHWSTGWGAFFVLIVREDRAVLDRHDRRRGGRDGDLRDSARGRFETSSM